MSKHERRDRKLRRRREQAPGAVASMAYYGGPDKLFVRKIRAAIYRDAIRRMPRRPR